MYVKIVGDLSEETVDISNDAFMAVRASFNPAENSDDL